MPAAPLAALTSVSGRSCGPSPRGRGRRANSSNLPAATSARGICEYPKQLVKCSLCLSLCVHGRILTQVHVIMGAWVSSWRRAPSACAREYITSLQTHSRAVSVPRHGCALRVGGGVALIEGRELAVWPPKGSKSSPSLAPKLSQDASSSCRLRRRSRRRVPSGEHGSDAWPWCPWYLSPGVPSPKSGVLDVPKGTSNGGKH